jgi:hypothetical protein
MITTEVSKLPSPRLPFLYAVLDSEGKHFEYFVVKIAQPFDYVNSDTSWMEDAELPPGRTLEPSLDLQESSHRFKSEAEAIAFIAQWWKKQTTFEACMALYQKGKLDCSDIYAILNKTPTSALPLSGPAIGTGAGG